MPIVLPTDLLRSFLAVVEAGTLRRASARIHRTPSALSLQMDRLATITGLVLFERRGRTLALTSVGETLVIHAREILNRHDAAVHALRGASDAGRARLGLVQDFAEPLLAGVLARLRAVYPHAQIEIRIAGSADLRRAVAVGEIDVALAVRGESGPKPIRVEPMVWLGERRLSVQEHVPLVLVTPPCPFGAAALETLEAARRSYRVSLQTPSLLGVRAAIEAGLGIGCRTRVFGAGRLPVLGADKNLPELPDVAYALLRGRKISPSATALADMVEDAVSGLPA